MTEFTYEILNSWKLQGYKFIRYRRIDENRVALKPFFEINEAQDTEEMYNYFSITEDEVREWADNADHNVALLDNFKFCVEAGFETETY